MYTCCAAFPPPRPLRQLRPSHSLCSLLHLSHLSHSTCSPPHWFSKSRVFPHASGVGGFGIYVGSMQREHVRSCHVHVYKCIHAAHHSRCPGPGGDLAPRIPFVRCFTYLTSSISLVHRFIGSSKTRATSARLCGRRILDFCFGFGSTQVGSRHETGGVGASFCIYFCLYFCIYFYSW